MTADVLLANMNVRCGLQHFTAAQVSTIKLQRGLHDPAFDEEARGGSHPIAALQHSAATLYQVSYHIRSPCC